MKGVRQQVHEALCGIGTFRIERAFSPSLARKLQKEAEQLFALPTEERNRIPGYSPPGVEGVRDYGPSLLRHFVDDRVGEPPRSPITKEACVELWEQARYWLRVVDLEFSTPLTEGAAGGPHMLRRSQYLNEDTSRQVLFPPHRDFGLLTFYVGGAAEGLQMKIQDEWCDVWNPPGSLIAAAGTTLRLYAPEIISVQHQVVGSRTGRISTVFFTEPRADVVLPNGVRAGDHLARLVRQIRTDAP